MENFNAIEFHLQRDFSKKINVTFEFFRQNFKSLVAGILVIAGPPILMVSLIAGLFMGDFFKVVQGSAANPGDTERMQAYLTSPGLWLQFLLIVVFGVVSSVMLIATINNYILLYGEKRTNKISVQEIWDRVRGTFWMYFGTALFFFLLAIALYIVLIIPMVVLGAISPVLIFFGVIFFFGAVIYLIISVSLTFFVRAYEKIGFFEALTRSFRLVKDKWWSTFGLLVILYLIVLVISYIPMIPFYGIMMANMIHDTTTDQLSEPSMMSSASTLVFFAVYYLFQMVLSALPNIGIAFQYFNLVELKESTGLMNRIDAMGQEPQSPHDGDEHY